MTVRIISPERQRKAKRELGRDAAKVVGGVRTTRASLAAVTKLVTRTRREVETETDDGRPTVGWIQSSERERLEDFYKAMTWLQQAENEMRHLRGREDVPEESGARGFSLGIKTRPILAFEVCCHGCLPALAFEQSAAFIKGVDS